MNDLSMAQIYLLLDGAEFNAPVMADDSEDSDIPDAPDLRTKPVEFYEWELRHSPFANAASRRSDEEIAALCAKFRAEIETGEKYWSEQDKRWVRRE